MHPQGKLVRRAISARQLSAENPAIEVPSTPPPEIVPPTSIEEQARQANEAMFRANMTLIRSCSGDQLQESAAEAAQRQFLAAQSRLHESDMNGVMPMDFWNDVYRLEAENEMLRQRCCEMGADSSTFDCASLPDAPDVDIDAVDDGEYPLDLIDDYRPTYPLRPMGSAEEHE